MKKLIITSVLATLIFIPTTLATTTLTDDFSNGISATNWAVIGQNTGIPWSVSGEGQLKISKPADSGGPNRDTIAGIRSNFFLVGDFSISYNYSLPVWPHPGSGYNLARIYFYGQDASGWGYTVGRHNLRGNSSVGDPWECTHFRAIQNGINTLIGTGDNYPDTANNSYLIGRQNGVISAFVNHGNGLISLGSVADPYNNKPISFELVAQQGVRPTGYRSFSALDVRYDNIVITADAIVPEPCTLLMLGLGGVLIRKR